MPLYYWIRMWRCTARLYRQRPTDLARRLLYFLNCPLRRFFGSPDCRCSRSLGHSSLINIAPPTPRHLRNESRSIQRDPIVIGSLILNFVRSPRRIDTITKQAEIAVEAKSAAEALQQIAYYDIDLQPIEGGVGEIKIKVENLHEERTHVTEGGHFVIKDATGFSVCYVYALTLIQPFLEVACCENLSKRLKA